jgi:hypothetical protein
VLYHQVVKPFSFSFSVSGTPRFYIHPVAKSNDKGLIIRVILWRNETRTEWRHNDAS